MINIKSAEAKAWKDSLDIVKRELEETPAIEDYEFLKERYKDTCPPNEENLYNFTACEIKEIRKEVAEAEFMAFFYEEQIDINKLLKAQKAYNEELITNLKDENKSKQEKINELLTDLKAERQKVYELKRQYQNIKKKLRIWQAGSLGGGVLVLGGLILL